MSQKKYNWGVLGTGYMATQFSRGIKLDENSRLLAVASRSEDKAKTFAEKNNIHVFYSSYEELMENSSIDIVYIATPHTCHADEVRMALLHGKNVCCEKTFTMSAAELEPLIELAREKNLLLMEAVWMRFLPTTCLLRDVLKEDIIGKIKLVTANFGYVAADNPNSRTRKKQLGGGCLLDNGVYAVNFCSMVLKKEPDDIKVFTVEGETEVDDTRAIIMKYKNGEIAEILSSIDIQTNQNAVIYGEKGYITVPRFWSPTEFTITLEGEQRTFKKEFVDNGYYHTAKAFTDLLTEGKTESDVMPLDESLEIMKTLDTIRK